MTEHDGVDRILGQWATQRPDLDTEAMGIFGRIFRLARAGGDATAAAYARSDLTRGDFDVLATLRRSGADRPLSPSALSATLMLTSGGMTQRIDRLERAGLVRRSPDPADRRALRVSLTERGAQVVDRAVEDGLAAEQRLLAGIPPERRREVDAMLRELLAAVDAS
ncbi:MarR family transcriptional regulator [Cellulomonas hominis]|jgi:DNA-binding MarR family transcriptional regulator|uniref:MarR family transcriptional regulator n=1 Tax=Cellulomonas hominis TaxID=156981 RepID=A0A511FDD5_9CELL|nr:MarR family transcriptional regulator [Cellulomonas hominis]MBB5474196.1 DNA-binding MarR family transcriptional regulator [Cellulomonas hominis]NKY09375.1 MarR family transcriptional regulator [Cellulomonas hominis]GEL47241.1 MarR family transcriptional regulator [Cellulomonas hominis]